MLWIGQLLPSLVLGPSGCRTSKATCFFVHIGSIHVEDQPCKRERHDPQKKRSIQGVVVSGWMAAVNQPIVSTLHCMQHSHNVCNCAILIFGFKETTPADHLSLRVWPCARRHAASWTPLGISSFSASKPGQNWLCISQHRNGLRETTLFGSFSGTLPPLPGFCFALHRKLSSSFAALRGFLLPEWCGVQ